jgi:hypothetical protein
VGVCAERIAVVVLQVGPVAATLPRTQRADPLEVRAGDNVCLSFAS